MKFSVLFILPAMSLAFAPVRIHVVPSTIVRKNQVSEFCDNITGKTEDAIAKADDLVISRAMRLADHAPILVTLKALADKVGSSRWGIDAAPSAFAGQIGTALTIPTAVFNVWALISICQLASVAKSALADGQNELSQVDITSTAIANVMATRAIGSSTPLLATGLTALVSGYALRRNGADGAVTIHKAPMQIMSSFTTVLTVLGGVSALAAKLPLIKGRTEVVSTMGVAAYYLLATRRNNGTVRKAVNAGVVGGVLYARLAASGLALTTSSLLSVSLAATAYVAYEAMMKLKNAIA